MAGYNASMLTAAAASFVSTLLAPLWLMPIGVVLGGMLAAAGWAVAR